MRNFMKKMMITSMAAVLALAVGCGTGTGGGRSTVPPRIGILQDTSHAAAQETTKGFILALADNGYLNGQTVILVENDAQGESGRYTEIAAQYASDAMDLILAVGVPAAIAAVENAPEINTLGAAIQNFQMAGLNISGTTDGNPIEAQLELLKELVPDAVTAGILYSEEDTYAGLQVEQLKDAAGPLGMDVIEAPVGNSADIGAALDEILAECDVLYVPEDTMIISAADKVYKAASAAGIPVIVSSKELVENGGLATAAIDYTSLGYQTGLMAVEIFNEGGDPASMPIRSSAEYLYYINGAVAEALGIDIPASLSSSVI